MKMSRLESFLKELYMYLVENDNIDNNIIRKHTRKLETLGDISFPIEINSWYHLLESKMVDIGTIFEYASLKHKTTITEATLIKTSSLWPLHIFKYELIRNNCHMFLDRTFAFTAVIQEVLHEKNHYGSFALNASVIIETDSTSFDRTKMNLTDLRLLLIKHITENFLAFNGSHTSEDSSSSVLLTTRSSRTGEDKRVVVCGPVLNSTRSKDVMTTADDFYKQRAVDMQMMAEHKYGLRVTSKPGWQDFFVKLGNAAVTIDLLQNKLNHTITVDLNDHYVKSASFILYNCARLSTLLKEFDKKVESKMYQELPPFSSIDISLLTQPEEWELLYVYILQFPQLIKSCIKDILHCKINVHYLVSTLSSMTSLFSVYYRRIRILTEPRTHLFPVLHARIYLLKAIEQVLHNGLHLLSIEPVKQM